MSRSSNNQIALLVCLATTTFGRCWARAAIKLRSRLVSAAISGNVRVGLEDSLWDGPGQLAKSNASQVRRIRTVIEALSLEVATPDDAHRILQLKGGNNVAL